MKVYTHYSRPGRVATGLTRPALPLVTQSGNDKSSLRRESSYQGGCIPLRIGSVNVGSLRGRDGEVVNMCLRLV